jgi:DNA processing protein
MKNPDLPYWLGLVRFPKFGAMHIQKFMRAFPNMESAFNASALGLIEIGVAPKVANRFLQERMHIDPMKEYELMVKEGVRAVTRIDEDYPALLNELYDPPGVLFVRGALPDETKKHLAVVGSRKATSYGYAAVEKIIEPIAKSGVVIVSGLAYGIDSLAHKKTVECGGTTVAVLGSGIDHASIYPSQNRTLASHIIASGGAVISEFPVGTPPLRHHFPFRNRVIAGLSHGTLVIEAALKSGSLITARSALESGREVYAVPGSIHSPLSEGPNNLIKMGATPVTSPEDIFEMKMKKDVGPAYEPQSKNERIIYELLSSEPLHVDEITHSSELPIGTVSSTLTMLEMKGAIKHTTGRHYTR